MRSKTITTQPITTCLSIDTRLVTILCFSRAVNRKLSETVCRSDLYKCYNLQIHSFGSSLTIIEPGIVCLYLFYINQTHTKILTGCDVGQSLFLTEGQNCWFSLSRELVVHLYKLLCYVEVVKIIYMKVMVFVQDCPVHKCKMYKQGITHYTVNRLHCIIQVLSFTSCKTCIQ